MRVRNSTEKRADSFVETKKAENPEGRPSVHLKGCCASSSTKRMWHQGEGQAGGQVIAHGATPLVESQRLIDIVCEPQKEMDYRARDNSEHFDL